MAKKINIILAGNPNSGKSSLFNALTGLNQKVGNFPGVTVDKKTGNAQLNATLAAHIIDLPGTYSLYPKSADELVAYNVLLQPHNSEKPDIIVVVADATNLKRSLLLCTQIMDLRYPVVLALTMIDIAKQQGMQVNTEQLSAEMGISVVSINPRKQNGIANLKETLLHVIQQSKQIPAANSFTTIKNYLPVFEQIKQITEVSNNYAAAHIAINYEQIRFISTQQQQLIAQSLTENNFSKASFQADEIVARYKKIDQILNTSVHYRKDNSTQVSFTQKADKILLHKYWGNALLLLVLFVMFQTIFWLAAYPMDWIEQSFAWLQAQSLQLLPTTWWTDLLVNGLLAGIGGVVIFIPQIALLFGIITLLEDTGYMARISFLSDRVMRATGLNGRSVMPLISGLACAIPAVMSARTIENPKERLITILVTPFMSCSARLPIYIILIALVVPNQVVFGFIQLQGLVMLGMYLLGFVMALAVARILNVFIKAKGKSYFLMELPVYRSPRWRNVWITMYEKAKVFTTDAGKIILIISVILWALASFGPNKKMQALEMHYSTLSAQQNNHLTPAQEEQFAAEKLENSYAGILGKTIEPAIAPLGYDWKIGIALIASFAAREVFVGTIATLYSVGDADEHSEPLRQKMHNAKRTDGTKVYTFATGISLLVFYAFAMQCMSTIAIVKRELKSWKWPLIQLVYMTALAYLAAFGVYQVLS